MIPAVLLGNGITCKSNVKYYETLVCSKELEKENFIMTRLEELMQSGCIKKSQDGYVLTSAGRGIAGFLNVYQKLLGRPMGG